MARHNRTRLLRLPQVEARTGLTRADIYRRLIANPPRFPRPVKCGASSHFVESEVDQWIAEQVAGRDGASGTCVDESVRDDATMESIVLGPQPKSEER